ncbi:MAG: M50 family metallopeptidase [Thermoanaerobaculia bacterium]
MSTPPSVESLLAELEAGARPAAAPPPDAPTSTGWLPLLVALALLWLLWSTWVVYPLKLLVVLFHELSHGLAAVATGGEVLGIELVPQEGGLCKTAGGSRFLVLSAGYLGSLVWGGLILNLAARSRRDRLLTAILGALLLATALFWVRPMLSFGMVFALAAGLALLAAARWLSPQGNDFLLRLVGLTSMLYAVFDIQDDVLSRPHLSESDAGALAALTGIPTLVWGFLWIGLAVLGAGYFLFRSLALRPGTGARSA